MNELLFAIQTVTIHITASGVRKEQANAKGCRIEALMEGEVSRRLNQVRIDLALEIENRKIGAGETS